MKLTLPGKGVDYHPLNCLSLATIQLGCLLAFGLLEDMGPYSWSALRGFAARRMIWLTLETLSPSLDVLLIVIGIQPQVSLGIPQLDSAVDLEELRKLGWRGVKYVNF